MRSLGGAPSVAASDTSVLPGSPEMLEHALYGSARDTVDERLLVRARRRALPRGRLVRLEHDLRRHLADRDRHRLPPSGSLLDEPQAAVDELERLEGDARAEGVQLRTRPLD